MRVRVSVRVRIRMRVNVLVLGTESGMRASEARDEITRKNESLPVNGSDPLKTTEQPHSHSVG